MQKQAESLSQDWASRGNGNWDRRASVDIPGQFLDASNGDIVERDTLFDRKKGGPAGAPTPAAEAGEAPPKRTRFPHTNVSFFLLHQIHQVASWCAQEETKHVLGLAMRFLFSFPRAGPVPHPMHEHFVRDVFEPMAKTTFAAYLRRVGPNAAFDDAARSSTGNSLNWSPHGDIAPVAYTVQRIIDDFRRSAVGADLLQLTAGKYGYWIAQSALQTEILSQVVSAIAVGQDARLVPVVTLPSYRTTKRSFVHRFMCGHAVLQQDISRQAWNATCRMTTTSREKQEVDQCCEIWRVIPCAAITFQDIAKSIHEFGELANPRSRSQTLLRNEVRDIMRAHARQWLRPGGRETRRDNDLWSRLSARARGHLQDKGVPIFLFGADWAPLRDMIPMPWTVLRQPCAPERVAAPQQDPDVIFPSPLLETARCCERTGLPCLAWRPATLQCPRGRIQQPTKSMRRNRPTRRPPRREAGRARPSQPAPQSRAR